MKGEGGLEDPVRGSLARGCTLLHLEVFAQEQERCREQAKPQRK